MSTITAHRIRCGCCLLNHTTAAEVAACYADAEEAQAQANAELAAELAYERHLEDRGWQEALLQEQVEAARGVIGFREAWHLASPDTCPCCDH